MRRDPTAFELLYDRWSTSTFRLAHAILHDQSLSEQVIEEVFLALWHEPETVLAGHSTLGGHLGSAVRSHAVALAAHARVPSTPIEAGPGESAASLR